MLDAPKEMIDKMISLFKEGDIVSTVNNSNELIAKYPNNATIWEKKLVKKELNIIMHKSNHIELYLVDLYQKKNKWLTHLQDFFIISIFGDFLFHTQEKQFTLQEIKIYKWFRINILLFWNFRNLNLFRKENKSFCYL